jgi:hypothetical protein
MMTLHAHLLFSLLPTPVEAESDELGRGCTAALQAFAPGITI